MVLRSPDNRGCTVHRISLFVPLLVRAGDPERNLGEYMIFIFCDIQVHVYMYNHQEHLVKLVSKLSWIESIHGSSNTGNCHSKSTVIQQH